MKETFDSDEQYEMVGGPQFSSRSVSRRVFGIFALFMLMVLGLCLLASHAAEENAAAARVPDVVKTYHNCEFQGIDTVMVNGVSFDSLKTSCGLFNLPLKKIAMDKGKTYEIEVTESASVGTYISDITLSSAASK